MTRFFFMICSALLPVMFNAQPNTYDIYALKFGERNNYIAMKDAAVGDRSGDSSRVFFMYWLLKGTNGKTILVDAGFTEDAGTDPQQITFTAPQKLLALVNVKPEEVTDIIITHPHWDHVGGIDLYPNAMAWMQEEDYHDFVTKKDPESCGFNQKDIQKVRDRNAKGSLRLIKGNDQAILPGIRVFTGSKHTAGSQFVLASNAEKQSVIIASDNCKYYRNATRLLSSPATSDQKAYIRNLEIMRQLVKDPDLIVPGHDPLVFTKFKSVGANVVQIKK